MIQNSNHILTRGQVIDDKYTVSFFLKKGSYAETYRVVDRDKNSKLLKLFNYSKLHRTQFDPAGNVLEIDILKRIKHPNIVKIHDSGEFIFENQKFAFAILDYISGETLADKMKREQNFNPYEAKAVMLGLLNGLNYLHNNSKAILHNDITNLNVMLDLSGQVPVPKIIDFGYARYLSQPFNEFQRDGLNPFYLANETCNNVFSIQSDIFSVGALYYHLLFGLPPWFVEVPKFKSDLIKIEDAIIKEREKPLRVMSSNSNIEASDLDIITKALQPKAEYRFKSVLEFIQALNGEIEVENPQFNRSNIIQKALQQKKVGKGFDSIAGMQELKDNIKIEIIDAILNPEEYRKDNLGIPNGMLLYGPHGCGKTFFAEKMAEEIGFHFYQIKPSDIQSKWVNATQENIKELFDEARKNAPSVIFIDELDALVPDRDNSTVNHMNTSAVNEFLAQMNNSGEDGIFIIAATNRPNAIDPAILRSGRLDKHVYLPPPDFAARKSLFELYLKSKETLDFGIDYNLLASLTENYSSSDIKLITDNASRNRIKTKSPKLTMDILLLTVNQSKSSLTKNDLLKYNSIKDEIEGKNSNNNDRPGIGFKIN